METVANCQKSGIKYGCDEDSPPPGASSLRNFVLVSVSLLQDMNVNTFPVKHVLDRANLAPMDSLALLEND